MRVKEILEYTMNRPNAHTPDFIRGYQEESAELYSRAMNEKDPTERSRLQREASDSAYIALQELLALVDSIAKKSKS